MERDRATTCPRPADRHGGRSPATGGAAASAPRPGRPGARDGLDLGLIDCLLAPDAADDARGGAPGRLAPRGPTADRQRTTTAPLLEVDRAPNGRPGRDYLTGQKPGPSLPLTFRLRSPRQRGPGLVRAGGEWGVDRLEVTGIYGRTS
jgi:hypothetical protein